VRWGDRGKKRREETDASNKIIQFECFNSLEKKGLYK
jgi:hypothetical protein